MSIARCLRCRFLASVLLIAAGSAADAAEKFQMALFHNVNSSCVDLAWINFPNGGLIIAG